MKTSQFNPIFDKLVSIGTTVKNFKSSSRSKLLTKDEKSYILDNYDKFVTKLKQAEKKTLAKILFDSDKLVADKFKISVKKYRELCQKAYDVCKCFNAGYSMGGTIRLFVTKKLIKQSFGAYNNCEEYAKSSRYKAIHGYNEIILTIQELNKLEIIGGVPTIRLDNNKIAECLMLVGRGSKHNYSISLTKGFITGNYHGTNVQDCKNWRERMYLQRLKERNPQLYGETIQHKKEKTLKRFVGFQHSIVVGNCETGTKAFAQKHNLDVKLGYNLGYLVSLEPSSTYVQRLFNNFI